MRGEKPPSKSEVPKLWGATPGGGDFLYEGHLFLTKHGRNRKNIFLIGICLVEACFIV
jgi:hypothetical protein